VAVIHAEAELWHLRHHGEPSSGGRRDGVGQRRGSWLAGSLVLSSCSPNLRASSPAGPTGVVFGHGVADGEFVGPLPRRPDGQVGHAGPPEGDARR
jgi:hypothetical protein